jgi:Fe-S oxidoreductase
MDRNREKSRCCGAGGGVKSSQPEKSLTMARKRLEDALETGSDYIVTCCPFCLVNLEEAGDMVVKDLTQHIMEGHS